MKRISTISGTARLLLAAGAFSTAFLMTACPKRLVGGYEIRNGKVYYQTGMKGLGTTHSFEVEGADADSFVELSRNYGRDKNHAYLRGKAIPGSDGSSFRLIEEPYAADNANVYYSSDILSRRPDSFKILYRLRNSIFSTDGVFIYKGKSRFHPDIVDTATFERIGRTDYFKDRSHVYSANRALEDADPATFEVRSGHNGKYARDAGNVYFNGSKVEGADAATHRVIDSYHHKDANSVYFALKKISDDPENFEVLTKAYSKDSRKVFWRSREVSGDPSGFKAFPARAASAYGKDRKNAYWCWRVIDGADAGSFVGLNHNYAKDRNNVYFAVNNTGKPRIMEAADPATFELVEGEKGIDARDKNNRYNFGGVRKNR